MLFRSRCSLAQRGAAVGGAPLNGAAAGRARLRCPGHVVTSDYRNLHASFQERARRHFSDSERRRGLLIAFEGADGSGKTTQRKLLRTWLQSEGYDTVTTKWNSSPLVKPIIKSRKVIRALGPEEFSLLHAADFRHRVEQQVLPALWDGRVVIADRFLFTGLARDVARGLDLEWVRRIYEPLLWPDAVFYFAISAETSQRRVLARKAPG